MALHPEGECELVVADDLAALVCVGAAASQNAEMAIQLGLFLSARHVTEQKALTAVNALAVVADVWPRRCIGPAWQQDDLNLTLEATRHVQQGSYL